jgi:hypothetical protein
MSVGTLTISQRSFRFGYRAAAVFGAAPGSRVERFQIAEPLSHDWGIELLPIPGPLIVPAPARRSAIQAAAARALDRHTTVMIDAMASALAF